MRPQIEDSATLVAKTFGTSRMILVASPALLSRHGPVREPVDLARLDTVAMSVGEGRTQWRLHGPRGQHVVHAHAPRYVADDLQMLVCATVAGTGIAMLPDYLCRTGLTSGELVEVLPGWGPPLGITHAVFPARRALVPAVRRLLDFLAETLKGDGTYELAG